MEKKEKEHKSVAEALLDGSGISVLEAARLALELVELVPPDTLDSRSPMVLYRHILRLGAEAYAQESCTVSFREAVERSLQSRASRRERTLAEIRQCCRRILHSYPELADMPVRRIGHEYCNKLVMTVFHTPTTQCKARRLLHGIFAFCLRHGWCAANPVAAVDVPAVREKPIAVLSIEQVRRLLDTARRPEFLPCAAAVGLMLWAGIRPTELTRLRWSDVQVSDGVITIDANHSKTGGARQTPLRPVLLRWLRETTHFRLRDTFIVPRSWVRRWRELRLAAGFREWHPDALRHTFASYHLKQFNDYKMLQADMGHANLQLLRTRYLSMRGITTENAAEFWGKKKHRSAGNTGNPET